MLFAILALGGCSSGERLADAQQQTSDAFETFVFASNGQSTKLVSYNINSQALVARS